MKRFILQFLVTGVALTLTATFIPGIVFTGGLDGLALITVVFTLINIVIKPVVKVLSLPIEVATLGLFTVIINTAMLLLVDYLLIPLTITEFWFSGIVYGPIFIAPLQVSAFITALLASLAISLISSVLIWLTK